jgi:WD40 repeat protein
VADGCVVYVNHGDGSAAELLDSHGIRDVATPDALKVNDVSPSGLVAAQTESTDSGSCSAVYDPSKGANVFETCDATLFAFSPDASFISGSASYLDGIGLGYTTILDATTGEELARFTPEAGFVRESVWEDPDHLLINAYEQGEWRIYRLGVDGSSEQVLSSTEGDDLTPAFTLLS